MSTLPRENNEDLDIGAEGRVEMPNPSALFDAFRNAVSENIKPVAAQMSAEALNSAGFAYAEMDETGITFGGSLDTPIGSVDVHGEVNIQPGTETLGEPIDCEPIDANESKPPEENESYPIPGDNDSYPLPEDGLVYPLPHEEPGDLEESNGVTFTGSIDTPVGSIDGYVNISQNGIDGGVFVTPPVREQELHPRQEPVKEAVAEDRAEATVNIAEAARAEATVNIAEAARAEATVNIAEAARAEATANVIREPNTLPEGVKEKPVKEAEASVDLSTSQASMRVNIPSLGSLNVHADKDGIKGILSGSGILGSARLRR